MDPTCTRNEASAHTHTKKRRTTEAFSEDFQHRSFAEDDKSDDALNFFKRFQYVHIHCRKSQVSSRSAVFERIIQFIKTHPKSFEAFQIDNLGSLTEDLKGSEVFCSLNNVASGSWYASAILQANPETEDGMKLSAFIEGLPVVSPTCLGEVPSLEYDNALWMFIGRNEACSNSSISSDSRRLMGRREHTDSVECSGTWHYQLLGEKIWRLRPDESWLDRPSLDNATTEYPEDTSMRIEKDDDNIARLSICCQEGDVIVVNTKIWMHQTEIPLQSSEGCLSFSYARDFTAPNLHD